MSTSISDSAVADVAIIGAGFSGSMTAVNLARLSKQPIRLLLINQNTATGRGIAYSTRRPEHLLNVAARNMSAFPDIPDHFVDWLRTRTEYESEDPAKLRERFVPRSVYGDYIKGLMQHYLTQSSPLSGVTTEMVFDEATDIDLSGETLQIKLASGRSAFADEVVLATGNEPPGELSGLGGSVKDHRAWVGNPWSAWYDRLPPHGGTIILLGTGLTAVDAILTLQALGWKGALKAVSRHGWLPNSHFRGIEYPDFPPPDVDLSQQSLDNLVKLVEIHCERLRARGANPAIVVDKLRPHTQNIWKAFSIDEKRIFTKRLAARWNVLRHRIAPEIHRVVMEAQQSGLLQVQAASIERVEAHGSQLRVTWSQETDRGLRSDSWDGDLVINATGPQTRFSATRSTLMQNLLKRGIIQSDEMDMGLQVRSDFSVIDRMDSNTKRLLAIGPVLRGTLWETIAVPELRGQAKRVAETILNLQADHRHWESTVMMEYMI